MYRNLNLDVNIYKVLRRHFTGNLGIVDCFICSMCHLTAKIEDLGSRILAEI